MSRSRLALAATCLSALMLPATAAAAAPAAELIIDDRSIPLSLDSIYPGFSETTVVPVSLSDGAPESRLSLELRDLVDLEAGCNRPERNSGDTTCGTDQGELSDQLRVSVELVDPVGDVCPTGPASTASATLASIASNPALPFGPTITAGAPQCVMLTFVLPTSADNLVQTDRVTFTLVVQATQITDTETPGGPDGPTGPAGPRGPTVPTGPQGPGTPTTPDDDPTTPGGSPQPDTGTGNGQEPSGSGDRSEADDETGVGGVIIQRPAGDGRVLPAPVITVTPEAASSGLPATGGSTRELAVAAAIGLLAGWVLLFFSRRRQLRQLRPHDR